MTAPLAAHGVQCVLCGGRRGWWSLDHREPCKRCNQTGWEPSPTARRATTRQGRT